MRVDINIKPEFSSLTRFVEELPDNFDNIGDIIHSGRNQIRIAEINGERLVIKYFKKITLFNKFIYGNVRKSKAKRSFENSATLLKNGIGTPKPVAYIDTFNHLLLKKSFYVYLNTDYTDIEYLLNLPLSEAETGIRAFARLSGKMHHAGIFHGDFNTSNVLFKIINGNYDFCLIDNNRMKFKSFTLKSGAKNFKRMKLSVEQAAIVGSEYSRMYGYSERLFVIKMLWYRSLFIFRENCKIKFKRLLHKVLNK
jgi:tRNA A-37 threonylcarbamoyl transferase component Bud32